MNYTVFVTRLSLGFFSSVFIVVGILLLPSPDPNLHFEAVMSLLCAAAIWLPLVIMRLCNTLPATSPRAQVVAELSWAAILAVNGLGAIHFYYTWKYYDAVLHFFLPIVGTVLIAILIMGIFERRQRYDLWMIRWLSIGLSGMLILAWEVFEYIGDSLFQTDMHGQIGEPLDTFYDVVLGYVGLVVVYKLLALVLPRLKVEYKK